MEMSYRIRPRSKVPKLISSRASRNYTTVSLDLRLFFSHLFSLSLQPRRHNQVPGRSLLVRGWRNYSDETKPTAKKAFKSALRPINSQSTSDLNSRCCAVQQLQRITVQMHNWGEAHTAHQLATMLHAEIGSDPIERELLDR